LLLDGDRISEDASFEEKIAKLQKYLPTGITEKILSQKDRIEGERRHITVMFCDIQGFTRMVEGLGPEKAYRTMDQVYEVLIHKVHDFQGTVNEMTGDGIMALFGAPIAVEDAPQRALRSALSIHEEIAKLGSHTIGKTPIRMRIGIHTGPVVIGTMGNDLRLEFKAVGDTINLASRMEGMAEPGTTYVTEGTYRFTKGLFDFESLGKRKVKGKEGAVEIYKLLSAKGGLYRARLGAERTIFSDMVGREKELDKLELQVIKVINGEGSIVNIVGEAGIGKSRLLAELKKRDVMKRIRLFEGRAIAMGRDLAFHPIIDILKQWAKIREYDGESAAFEKLQAAVKGLFLEKAWEVFPFVAILMGIKLSGSYGERVKGIEGEALEKLILKNVREVLIRATDLRPLVLVIEDLQWADASSIELMESLFQLVESRRILFINVYRSGYKDTGDRVSLSTRERFPARCHEITLEPLDRRGSEALIKTILKTSVLPHHLEEQIIERTGGNPYFIEEVMQSLIDEKGILLKNGMFQVTRRIQEIAIPRTVNDVLMARIDRLEENTRNLVRTASVIGKEFFFRVLADVATGIGDLDEKLNHLKEIRILQDRKRMGEVEYLFNHELVKEVAYESILAERRKELHLQVGRSIEKVFSGRLREFYGMLAYHYSKAEAFEQAEEYLIKAGEEALRSSASNEALHYYQKALGLYLAKFGPEAEPGRIAMLEKNIALALYNRGQYAEALEYFDKALAFYWGEPPRNFPIATLKVLSASFHLLLSLYVPFLKFRKAPSEEDAAVIELFYKKCNALAIIDPRKFFFEFLYLCKRVTNFDLAGFQLGLEIFVGASALFSFSGILFRFSRKVLDSARGKIRKNDLKLSINYNFVETVHNYLSGNWRGIGDYDESLVNRNLKFGQIWDVSQYLYWHGLSNIYRGSLQVSKSLLQRLDDIAEVYSNDFSLLMKYELKINLLMECRDLREALTEVERAVGFTQKSSFNIYLFDMYSYEIWIRTMVGDMEKAERALERAIEAKKRVYPVPIELSNFCRSLMEYDLCRLEKSLREKDQAGLVEYGKKAQRSGKNLLGVSKKAAQHRTEAYKLMGRYFWLINKKKKALRYWNRAIEEGGRLGARLELSRTYFEIGKRLRGSGEKQRLSKEIKVEAPLEKAREMFEEMGLHWDLEELDQVMNM